MILRGYGTENLILTRGFGLSSTIQRIAKREVVRLKSLLTNFISFTYTFCTNKYVDNSFTNIEITKFTNEININQDIDLNSKLKIVRDKLSRLTKEVKDDSK